MPHLVIKIEFDLNLIPVKIFHLLLLYYRVMIINEESITRLTRKERQDLKVLGLFIAVWCRAHHPGEPRVPDGPVAALLAAEKHRLCADCHELLAYAMQRRILCPLDPKPTCKHCTIHCYRPGHREQIREIMRFSGKALILRGRLDLLWHYFF